MANKIFIVFFGILFSIIAGLILSFSFWPSDSGRDFKMAGLITGIIIVFFAAVLRIKFRWTPIVLLITLIPVEVVTLFVIFSSSGSFAINGFNLQWLFGINQYIALPWVMGILIGCLYPYIKNLTQK